MYLNRFGVFFRYLFGRRLKLALCPVRAGKYVRCGLVVAAALSARMASASVLVSGDVTPSDNPFTLNVNEGLPKDGNKTDPFQVDQPPEQNQTFWEGINDPVNNTNINVNVIVGKTGIGVLQISQVELRDMNLTIGDSTTQGNGSTQIGTGTVYITGMGSLFNNNPNIVPPGLPANFRSKHPRLAEPGASTGFDLYVGKTGNGTLKIDAFGRAEIQDAVLVGDSVGSTGNLIVDGFSSSMISGGFDSGGGGGQNQIHMMILGRQGNGNMTVSAGATVDTESPPGATAGGSQSGQVGASLGSTPYTFTLGQIPDPGGVGTTTVTGTGSRWSIGGSLQIGGFDIGLEGGINLGDVEGDSVQYNSQAGRGTLYVNDGGLVNIHNSIGIAPTDTTTSLILAVGRFGVVQLNGGTIHLGSVTGTGGQGQNNQSTPDSVQVINDGIIRGSGTIQTGVFRNRYLGQVRVDAGQALTIDSSSQFQSAGGASPPEPLVNYGTIEVLGTSQAQAQLEFVRSPSNTGAPVRPFINSPLPTLPTPPAFVGGLISAQYANLRFGSGLQNQGLVSFTAGTNNISGKVKNLALDLNDTSSGGEAADGDAGELTQILVSGPGTTAIFENDLIFGPGADLNLVNGGNVVVMNQHSLILGGGLGIALSYARPSLVSVAGDVAIGGSSASDLTLNLDADVLHSLKSGDAFKIISFTGESGNVNVTDPLNPVADFTAGPQFVDIETSPSRATLRSLYGVDVVMEYTNEGVYAKFLNPAAVGSGAMGPDFNGDGVVDDADFAIWKANVGITNGASVLVGDADGDGDVDGADFLMWQRNVGKPKPWTGAGSGSGSGSLLAVVPEPTCLAMLVCGGSLALAVGRRRAIR